MTNNSDIRKKLGEQVHKFRTALAISPTEFAYDIGKDPSYVIQLEEGTTDVDLATLEKCAETFGMEVSELFDAVYYDARQ